MNKLNTLSDERFDRWAVRQQQVYAYVDDFAPEIALSTAVKIPTQERHVLQPRDEGRVIKLAFCNYLSTYFRLICFRVLSVETPWDLELELIADNECFFGDSGTLAKLVAWCGECPITLTLEPNLISKQTLFEDEANDLWTTYGENADEKVALLQQALNWCYRDNSEAKDN